MRPGPRTWLLLGAAALALVVAAEVRVGTVRLPDPVDRPPAAPVEPPSLVIPEIPALALLPQTVDRPLFSPDRRPPPVEEATPTDEAPVPVPTSAPQVTLSAIVIADGEPLAYLQDPAVPGGLRRAAVGDTFEGWTVTGIEEDRIVLESGGQRADVPLRTFLPPPAVSPAEARRARRRATASGASVDEPPLRPRRPLRGPRQRSLQRQAVEPQARE